MVLQECQTGKAINHFKMIRLIFTILFITSLSSCQNKAVVSQTKHQPIKIDTIISNQNSIVLNYKYCDLINSKNFTLINPLQYHIDNIDSLSYGFRIGKDTLLLTYQFSNSDKNMQDRHVIYNRKEMLPKRVLIKDSTVFEFNGFMCDYHNAKYYTDKDIILIKSEPSQFTGLMSQYEFYQVIDRTKNIVYEFFVNEYHGCNKSN